MEHSVQKWRFHCWLHPIIRWRTPILWPMFVHLWLDIYQIPQKQKQKKTFAMSNSFLVIRSESVIWNVLRLLMEASHRASLSLDDFYFVLITEWNGTHFFLCLSFACQNIVWMNKNERILIYRKWTIFIFDRWYFEWANVRNVWWIITSPSSLQFRYSLNTHIMGCRNTQIQQCKTHKWDAQLHCFNRAFVAMLILMADSLTLKFTSDGPFAIKFISFSWSNGWCPWNLIWFEIENRK